MVRHGWCQKRSASKVHDMQKIKIGFTFYRNPYHNPSLLCLDRKKLDGLI